ncbi:hypothetical protein PHLGIDRAFT_467514 [Phlebiopsis gigantea 11061_1 CR5-6]|uniref:Uncharacterized protein n=1 Tax=Phlebiopsis gigantea (strain 11061_1 CR5-6) TaxID=745531 RepID=A0A0C3S9G6_PHLG1|nr:hypothetical protein PHLGIDRAFT_467514 [Phlebiopsis gigantea 11061_1 CR5-6]
MKECCIGRSNGTVSRERCTGNCPYSALQLASTAAAESTCAFPRAIHRRAIPGISQLKQTAPRETSQSSLRQFTTDHTPELNVQRSRSRHPVHRMGHRHLRRSFGCFEI